MENLEKPLVNRVAQSGLVTLDLEKFFPEGEVVPFDLKDYLFMGLILKEKDFRDALQYHDWTQYRGKNIAVFCSADAIIPMWAYMLVTVHAAPFANRIFQGSVNAFYDFAFFENLQQLDFQQFEGKKVVVKGCGDKAVPTFAYAEITRRLQPFASSIMYGEPCSTVPIFKKPKT